MVQLGVMCARPHWSHEPSISRGLSLKSIPPQLAESSPPGLGREGVLMGGGHWQQGSGKDTEEGVQEESCEAARGIVRKGTREMAI